MSVISNRHSVVPFVAGKTSAYPTQRLAKVGYKTTEKQKAKFPSIAVSVPKVSDDSITEFLNSESGEKLIPHIRTFLETAQDGIIRSLYENSDGMLKEVGDDDISIDSCIAYMDAESTGSRLTKDVIQKWFDSELHDNLFVMIAEKLSFAPASEESDLTENQTKEVEKHVKTYKDVLSMLAGGKTMLADKQLKGCKSALTLVANESDVSVKLMARLTAMEKKPDIAELLEI